MNADKMTRSGVPIVVYLDNSLADWLQRCKDDDGIPKATVVRKALKAFKQSKEEKNEAGQ